MVSVMMTMVSIPASMASRTASRVKRAGTQMDDRVTSGWLAFRSLTVS
jgi:hypothetical protein